MSHPFTPQHIPARPPTSVSPAAYKPNRIEDFCGAAAQTTARLISAHIDECNADGLPILLFLSGPPGIGKSSLSLYAQNAMGVSIPHSHRRLTGAAITRESLPDHIQFVNQRDMFAPRRCLMIEECDRMTRSAQVDILNPLDTLAPSAAIVCTTNIPLEEFEDRFHSRFTVFNLPAPSAEDIATMMTARFHIPPDAARSIAEGNGGNVRACFKDASLYRTSQTLKTR